ncbi:elongation of very long chain fatty acids protein AAEL008004 [Diaphorina citri]|uniref:Elongation of very long chain fatty acids protein n=1 Tax=Diaphorina citri TaxID=121845 RepID=A0A3Q0INE1_DIACI|nr:elongation of very long chain fatty acids protein AAEL008004 [Diaphorina citri]
MAGLMKMTYIEPLYDRYTNLLDSISDPRVNDWFLMESPIPTLVMVGIYLYIVVFLGPWIMANRKPFKLKTVLIVYNAAQVIFSLAMLWEHLMSGWLLDYSYKCQPVDYSHNPTALRMANLCWWYYISKLTEFADTLSNLSIDTFIMFSTGGHGTFSNLINNIVHVIMYFYYMVSAMGPEYQKYLWWKRHLTTLTLQFTLVFFHSAQVLIFDCGYPKLVAALLLLHSTIFFCLVSVLQFTLVFFHSAQVLIFDCGYPKLVAALLLLHSTIFFCLFFDFYQQAYKKQAAKLQAKKLE